MTKTHRKRKSKRTNQGFDKRQWKALNDTSVYDSVVWDQFDMATDVSQEPETEWRSLNWKHIERRVFKLQRLIFKASSRGEVSFQAQIPKAFDQKLLRKVASCKACHSG